MNLHEKVAVVTGAGSGIGRALAQDFAVLGCHLALADINEQGLAETAKSLNASGVNVSTHVLDVSDRAAVEQFAEAAIAEHGHVDIVINNAGVQAQGRIDEVSYQDLEWVVNINMWGMVYGCKAFLPYLKQRPEAYLVNVASINSQVPLELGGAYNMSKAAVQALSETLMIELVNTNVNVLSVHPGGISTNLAKNARGNDADGRAEFDKLTKTTPEQAAAAVRKAVIKNRAWLRIGLDAKLLWLIKRISPRLVLNISSRITEKFFPNSVRRMRSSDQQRHM
jgi:NAD(P)-dependent dehydrogenase (short-subunit alcohol dehydrogenase family)